jgi:hypothetical protein
MSMTYDAARQKVVLFGGETVDANGTFSFLSDTWLWDGGNWVQASPANSPPARYSGAMTYDAAHSQVVLFGGSGNSMLSDTWVWDGTNWSLEMPANSPSPRVTSMVYDSSTQRVFLFGGWPGTFYSLSDTWAWDGVNWLQQSPTTSPSSRSNSAMVYDAARHNVVLFGGIGPGFFQISADTWLYHAGNLVDVTLSADSNQSSLGQPVSLTAAIHPATATGVVTFYGGTTILGTAPVVAGSAVFTTVTLPAGSGLLRAYYSGDATDSGDISPPVPHTVTAQASHSFVSSTIPVGRGPFAMVVADFNHDNKLDLAVANSAGGNVTVLLGNGAGGFTAAPGSPFPTGNGTFSLAVADFNNDGEADLAAVNSGDNTLSILFGDGRGGFAPAPGSPFPTGQGPISIAAADFNHDGIADLVVGCAGDNSVTLLLGKNPLGFTPVSRPPVPNFTYLAIGDFDADGLPDLALSGLSNFSASVTAGYTGFATGVGSAPRTTAGIVSLAVGDFNGDGLSDVAFADLVANHVEAWLGFPNGGPPLFPDSAGPFPVGISPESIATGDFNGDGKLDLVVANSDSSNLTMLLGDGTGNFSAAPSGPIPAGPTPFFVVVGDFNGDGRADLAVANFVAGTITILLGQ